MTGLSLGIGIVTVLGLGPLGLFVIVFICATSGGIGGNALLNMFGGGVYDVWKNGCIYHSIDDLIGNLR
jgi:hypothetical protein